MGGRSIRLFFVDGTPNGLRIAEFGLSTIMGVYIPRGSLQAFAKRGEAKRTGIYFLLGDDPAIPGRTKIYVGEADEVLSRLVAHDKDASKDFWDRAVAFVSKDQSLTKAHVRYLEAKLIDLALIAKRCTVDNRNGPNGGHLPEADEAEMGEFIEQVKLLLATMGIDALDNANRRPGSAAKPASERAAPMLQMAGDGYDAKCILVDGAFVVQQGSHARKGEALALGESSKSKRKELLASGILQEKDMGFEFTQDYAFGSASGAAQVVCGANVNGRTFWKLKDGSTFADWQEKQLVRTSSGAGD